MSELRGDTCSDNHDGYFNNLAQQPAHNDGPDDADERRSSHDKPVDKEQVPKPKRIACVLCRKRKLKCDGRKPSCGTCTRLQHDCSYDEVRKKSGPKRGYVKALEARLAQVETMLKTQDDQLASQRHAPTRAGRDVVPHAQGNMVSEYAMASSTTNLAPQAQNAMMQQEYATQMHLSQGMPGMVTTGEPPNPSGEPFPWEVIGLGLDEPLPTQDVIDELNEAYFNKVHPSLPMIHRPRYYAAMNLAPHMRPPACLRYAMWANAAAVTDKFEALQDHFYQRARKYIQQDEMKGHGESMVTASHCQTWILLATHEFKLMYFPRAWMSSGRASRMAQMMGLHRLDGSGLDVKQCLAPPKDWTEREERRRTFWMSFCVDRYSSIGTGWPMSIEENDILTNLPTDEEAFEMSRPAKTLTLFEALEPAGTPSMSSFAGVTVMACLFGRNLTHLHRPSPDDQDANLNGEFWRRHREMDNILLNTALALPDVLRIPLGLNNPNTIFMNMNIHTSTICLHQAAIFKADKNRLPTRISAESKVRCITAAAEIASIMRQISHLDLAAMNPFISFCLYVAARVFVQYLKTRSKDAQVRASLQFLLSVMHAIKRKNPLTESFLVQLDVDLEGAGLEDSAQLRGQMQRNKSASNPSPGCPTGHLGISEQQPTYGGHGLAVFNQPTAAQETRGYGLVPDLTLNNNSGGNTPQYDLPSRQRQPTIDSTNNLGMHHSPNNGFVAEMDTSPDGSGEQKTPGSSTQSLHNASSHTSYSPRNQQTHLNGVHIDPSHTDTMDFGLHTFTTASADAHQTGFVVPQAWTGTGMTHGATNVGLSSAGLNELMNGMTDNDWNTMMESLAGNGWDAGIDASFRA